LPWPITTTTIPKNNSCACCASATGRPRFGLVWERDEIDHDLSVNNDFVALDWDADLSCGDGPQDNLIIEGDNFDALRTLRMTHAGRVKCIYIDPPYNTGNRDFIYNDRFIDKDDNYRHSKWLEFMFRRLELAKELLTEDGVIFVSIDDNEVFHLGLLMEQVFGAANFIANVIWQKVYSPKSTAQHFSDDHEYIVCFALNKTVWRPNPVPRSVAQDKAYKNPDKDPRGPWKAGDLSARNFYSKGTYPITCPSGRVVAGPTARQLLAFFGRKAFLNWTVTSAFGGAKMATTFHASNDSLPTCKKAWCRKHCGNTNEVGHTQDAKQGNP
jgi:adenine-specific DNA-methyltransferase